MRGMIRGTRAGRFPYQAARGMGFSERIHDVE